MSAFADFSTEVRQRLDDIDREVRAGGLDPAIDLIVSSLQRGGVVQAFGTGHSQAFAMEIAGRAGGLIPTHAIVLRDGFNTENRIELFRAAHDIKGDAATFGFPSAGAAAESLCRIIEHAPDLDKVPSDLIVHHINAIQAIVRERTKLDTVSVASALSRQLRGVADEFLMHVNRDRPEHLEAILAPSIIPAE